MNGPGLPWTVALHKAEETQKLGFLLERGRDKGEELKQPPSNILSVFSLPLSLLLSLTLSFLSF